MILKVWSALEGQLERKLELMLAQEAPKRLQVSSSRTLGLHLERQVGSPRALGVHWTRQVGPKRGQVALGGPF